VGSRGQTCILFTAELRPVFGVPLGIDEWWLPRMLTREATRTTAARERIARIRAGA
jgi:hypothetical protein